LHDAISLWKEGEAHNLEVVFMEKDREQVENILKEIQQDKETNNQTPLNKPTKSTWTSIMGTNTQTT
jgi:low affinity Fe/Cu permease